MEITPIITEDFVVLKEDSTFSELIAQLKQFEKRTALVFRNNKYLGLIEKKHLLRSRMDVTEAQLKGHIQGTPLLNENEDAISVAYIMFEGNLDFLPVEKEKKIIGVVRALDLVKLAVGLPEVKKLKVSDVRLQKPKGVKKDDPLVTAIELMHDERVDNVPVYDSGKVYGIISYKDVLRKYLNWSPKRDFSVKFNKIASSKGAEANMPKLASLPASSFSTNDNLLTTTKGTDLKAAVEIMVRNNVSDLLVMDKEKLEGLLTIKNMLRLIGSLKIPKNFNIQFIGLNQVDLEPHEKYNIQKISSNEAFKLQRQVHNDFKLILHFKEYEKDGRQHKYSVNLRIEYPGKIVTSTEDDWDVETALRKAFENAKNELSGLFRKKVHVATQRYGS